MANPARMAKGAVDLGIPVIQQVRIAVYILGRMLRSDRRFPLVLMLEPLFRCNLHCRGCGKLAHPAEIMRRQMTVAECLDAADECGAPVVSIAGGEPLLHAGMPRIVRGLTDRRRFVYLCTNGLLVKEKIAAFAPSVYLTFNVHLDGLRERHDAGVCRRGVFDTAVAAIRLLVARGFRVTTNTTFFGDETPASAARFFDFLTSLGVEGMTVAPGFSYAAAASQDIFLGRARTQALFRGILKLAPKRGWRFNHSPLYLDFLAGNQPYACTPWGNPTRNIFGWQRPCYLLDDGYALSFAELMADTDWQRYGVGRDPRCADCMVHCGFEPSAVIDAVVRPWKLLTLALRQAAGS